MTEDRKVQFPIQPIHEHRFVPNRIVRMLLDDGPFDMNKLACMDFTAEERTQFAQLIGYSISGFSELSYADDETVNAAFHMANEGMTEEQGRTAALRSMVERAREGVRAAATALFCIAEEDLSDRMP